MFVVYRVDCSSLDAGRQIDEDSVLVFQNAYALRTWMQSCEALDHFYELEVFYTVVLKEVDYGYQTRTVAEFHLPSEMYEYVNKKWVGDFG